MQNIVRNLCCIIAFVMSHAVCFCQCHYESFEKLKVDILGAELSPILADPPTEDYESFEKDVFVFQVDSCKVLSLKRFSKEFEPYIVQRIDSGYSGITWAYLAASLKYQSAIVPMKSLLLRTYHLYRWEGYDYSDIGSYYAGGQFPYQQAIIAALEHISGKPLMQSVQFTKDEVLVLKQNATFCKLKFKEDPRFDKGCFSKWILEDYILKK
jgi:hypothetical protein